MTYMNLKGGLSTIEKDKVRAWWYTEFFNVFFLLAPLLGCEDIPVSIGLLSNESITAHALWRRVSTYQIQRCGPFDAARLILGGASRSPLRDRYEAFFTDYSLVPLLVHQNYLSSLMTIDAKTRTEVTSSAAAAVSDADIITGKMRCDFWRLLTRAVGAAGRSS